MSKSQSKRAEIPASLKKEICEKAIEKEKAGEKWTHKQAATWVLTKSGITIDETTLSKIRKEKEKWLNDSGDPNRTREVHLKFPELERALVTYFTQLEESKVPYEEAAIVLKAEEFSKKLKVPENELTFSSGWLQKFKQR